MIWTVSFGAGRRRRFRSLEGYANRARVLYTVEDVSVFPGYATGDTVASTLDDTAEQAIYGVIEDQENLGRALFAVATARVTELLSRRKRLLWLPETGSLGTDAGGAATIELECYGFWRTLFYRAYTAQTTGTADVSTVVQNLLTATAPFISTSYDQMATTGTSVERQFDTYDLAGDLIKELVGRAAGYTFQIAQDRVPVLKTSNRLSTAVDYYEHLDGTLTNAGGAEVPLWEVRPDSVLRQVDFVPASANLSAAIEGVESVYLQETTWRTPGELSYRAAVPGLLGEVNG